MAADVLVVSASTSLVAQVRRLCALAGCGCDVERDSSAVRAGWRQAALVVVGDDLAPAVAAAGLARRDRVFVATEGQLDAAGWSAAPKPPSAYLAYTLGEDGSLWTGTDPSKPGAVFYRFDGEQWQTIPMPAQTGTGSRNRGGFDYTALPGTGNGMIAVGTAPGGGPLAMTNQPAS